jgi:hydroxymethylglutaryl-CoA lyase
MNSLPKFVEFHEEGPREGFQIEEQIYPLEQRVKLIEMLAESGLRQVQVGSFVNPRAVPQMADTDQLFARITKRPGVRYTALWLNQKGFEKAVTVPQVDLDGKIMLYTTDEFSIRNNNCNVAENQQRQSEWIRIYGKNNIAVESVYVMTAFGCNFQGEVELSAVLDQFKFALDACAGSKLPHLYLADTMGWANPTAIKERVAAVRELAPAARIGLHLHDTRGMGPANFYAALEIGVDLFDSSVAGLGGCPFASHAARTAAGNICTEDMVLMCQEMGVATGIDLDKLIAASKFAEQMIGRMLNGKVMHGGNLDHYRKAMA